ncbi:MAG: hypothetical protein Q7S26_03325 [bacterium]|nr:hypothetical protein [bacterium]
MVDIELMDDLKVERKNCQYHPVGGIGGEGGDGWITNVTVLVDEFNVEYESQVIFTRLHSQIILLGQKDFFRKFRVDFEGSKGVFRIRKVPKLEI